MLTSRKRNGLNLQISHQCPGDNSQYQTVSAGLSSYWPLKRSRIALKGTKTLPIWGLCAAVTNVYASAASM